VYSDDSVSRVCGIGCDDVKAESVVVQDEFVEGGGAVVDGWVVMVVNRVDLVGRMMRVDGGVEVVEVVLVGV